ncbi:diguanylate cyclase (GGDEF) domain-containing protein [Marinomonas polaris DSM 16579]|uniref:diguanylate cyclase n=2 Tax=Marinomonas TaxID=28253 RepID=A0A1M4X8F6_9GAMM|nr:diguanylate cyclase (GGDEF) domain-containing protein [Marinomonas polaris DSM 16579]
MVSLLEKWFGTQRTHPDFRFRGFLFSALLFISSSFVFFIYYNLVIDYFPPMLIANSVSLFFCIIGGYYLLIKKRPKVAATILQLIVSIDTFILILIDGNEEFALVFAFLTPVMGVFLLGYRNGSILSLVYFAGIFYFCFTQMDTWQPEIFLPISLIHFSFIYSLLLIVSFFYDSSRRKAYQMMEETNRQLQELATTDVLTKLRNRRYMEDQLLNAIGNHYIAMLDVDDFKKVNDQFGHDQGDKVLIKLAEVLMHNIDLLDTVGRWGGEEFIIIFAEQNLAQLEEKLKQLNYSVAHTDFGIGRPITISIGLANHYANRHRDCIRAMDQALYDAKANGKNTYSIAS